jgi:MFS family permease
VPLAWPDPPGWWTGQVGVLRQPDFLKLWSGLTVSLVGMQVSGLALPLTAVLFLGASGTEMGILSAARWLPYLVFGLLAGAWLDRVRRRPVLIATHVGRALLLASIPAGAVFGWLRIEQLYVVMLALGSLMIFSDAAYQALLPALVSREELVAWTCSRIQPVWSNGSCSIWLDLPSRRRSPLRVPGA